MHRLLLPRDTIEKLDKVAFTIFHNVCTIQFLLLMLYTACCWNHKKRQDKNLISVTILFTSVSFLSHVNSTSSGYFCVFQPKFALEKPHFWKSIKHYRISCANIQNSAPTFQILGKFSIYLKVNRAKFENISY